MAAPNRLLTGPIRVTRPLGMTELAMLVSADAVARWARDNGGSLEWRAATLAGDLGGQRDTERELAREGLDRAVLGHDEFVARVRSLEAGGRAKAQLLLDRFGATVDLDAGAVDHPEVVRAARTAFVRLYEAGRLTVSEEVVDVCPRCETVVDRADSEVAESPTIHWLLELPLLGEPDQAPLVVATAAPELLAGAVAVAVPEGHPATGGRVQLPVAGRPVPIFAFDVSEPTLLVPAHDEAAWTMARQLGLAAIEVLDSDGTVRVDGPLRGLARFAAREQAAVLLAADHHSLPVAQPTLEIARRCRRCRTVVVPILGRHWFLAMADFEVAAADFVREGRLTFHPAAVGDELVTHAGDGGAWCLSRQVWAGQPVPVATCLDCCQRAVGVDLGESCGKCMGTLVADDDVLDARFVAAVWPLAVAGWPQQERDLDQVASGTMAMVVGSSVRRWALPSLAIAVAVAGMVPYGHLAVLDMDDSTRLDAASEQDVTELLVAEGRSVARAAVVMAGTGEAAAAWRTVAGAEDEPTGMGDLAAARVLANGVAAMPEGETDVAGLAAAVAAAYRQGAPGLAGDLLVAAMTSGIPMDDGDRDCVRRLAGPILGT